MKMTDSGGGEEEEARPKTTTTAVFSQKHNTPVVNIYLYQYIFLDHVQVLPIKLC